MEATDRTELYKKLAAFQQECPIIHKAKAAYENKYTYAGLPEILPVINPLLKKHGLGFTQLLQGKALETVIFCTTTGQSITSTVDILEGVTLMKMNAFQVAGSGITYYRRYALSAALGIVTDADADGQGKQIADEGEDERILERIKTIHNAKDLEEFWRSLKRKSETVKIAFADRGAELKDNFI